MITKNRFLQGIFPFAGTGLEKPVPIHTELSHYVPDGVINQTLISGPYGNYNRIKLSHRLSGEERDADIFLNASSWHRENSITLHAGVRVGRIDKFTKHVFSDDVRADVAESRNASLEALKGASYLRRKKRFGLLHRM